VLVPLLSVSRPRLSRRTPGLTDLRVFTTELIPAGRHRPDRTRPRLRVVLDRQTGLAELRPVLLSPYRRSAPAAAPDNGKETQ
jgi:hypothetical protein